METAAFVCALALLLLLAICVLANIGKSWPVSILALICLVLCGAATLIEFGVI